MPLGRKRAVSAGGVFQAIAVICIIAFCSASLPAFLFSRGIATHPHVHQARLLRTDVSRLEHTARLSAVKSSPAVTPKFREPIAPSLPFISVVTQSLSYCALAAVAYLAWRQIFQRAGTAKLMTMATTAATEEPIPIEVPPVELDPPKEYPKVDLSGSLPILILPGLGNCTEDYYTLKASLESRGARRVEILPVKRLDWLRNAAGLVDPAYWKGTLQPRPILNWYLDRIDTLIEEVGQDVTLIGHSAGGWLARVFLGESLDGATKRRVKRLVTLGTPHLPAAEGSNAPDQTRGLLDYINREFPGAFHPEVEYVCVAGKHRKGAFFWDDPAKDPDCNGTRFEKFIVGAGYWTVCGSLQVWGDSIVPVESALLPNATQVVLQGVYHSPLGDDRRAREWYGAEENLDKWGAALV